MRIADKFETEKTALTRDVADLTNKLVDARVSIADLEEESDQYRNDCNIAVQLLQCKPSNFVAHKFTTVCINSYNLFIYLLIIFYDRFNYYY